MIVPNSHLDTLWDGTKSAGLYSGLAGVLAGFCFVALTLIITSQPKDENSLSEQSAMHGRSVRTLTAAFLTLIVTSYLWGDAAGDGAYQVRSAISLAGPTVGLGLGSLQMLLAITQVLHYFDPGAERTAANAFALLIALATLGFGATAASAVSFMGYTTTAITVVTYAFAGMVLILIYLGRHSLSNWRDKDWWHNRSQRFTAITIVVGAAVYCVLPNSSSRWSQTTLSTSGTAVFHLTMSTEWRIGSLFLTVVVYGLGTLALWMMFMSLPNAANPGPSPAEATDSQGTVSLP